MTPTEIERQLLARIRGLSARAKPAEIDAELAALSTQTRGKLPSTDLIESLCTKLSKHGATYAVAQDRSEAVREISTFVAGRHSQRRIVCGHDPRLAALPWRDGGVLPRFGIAQVEDAVAVSYASAGIAETGSLAIALDRDNPARNNLLTEDHIIIVSGKDVHAHLEDLLPEKAAEPPWHSRGLMLISGPSSTADIAMELVMGAHGPRALHVIVIGGQSGL